MKRSEKEWKTIRLYNLEQRIGPEKFEALQKIARLNRKSMRAWEYANGEYVSSIQDLDRQRRIAEKYDKISEAAWDKAKQIAEKYSWELDAPGLWWTVSENGKDYLTDF